MTKKVMAYGFMLQIMVDRQDFYEMSNKKIIDKASELGLDKITGGRSVVSGHILSNNIIYLPQTREVLIFL